MSCSAACSLAFLLSRLLGGLLPFDPAREAMFALLAARDRWERTEQLPSSLAFVCLSSEEMGEIVDGGGLLVDVLRRDMAVALEREALGG